jgi:hypothetical protein
MKKAYSAFVELKKNRRLKPYSGLCFAFLCYLRDKEHVKIFIDGYDRIEGDYTFIEHPYMHRWKPEYTRYRLAQFYALEEWAKQNPLPLTMLTFTTYHDNPHNKRVLTIDKSWEVLKAGFRKASNLVIKIKKSPYVWVVEPQPDSGYPHIHAGYFAEFDEYEQDRLKNHWSRVLAVGNYENGLHFDVNQEYNAGDITSLRNYLMKYMRKTFVDTIHEWKPEELVFNAVAWHYKYRLFGCSQDISAAMHIKSDSEMDNFQWLRTSLSGHGLSGEPLNRVINKDPSFVFGDS